MVTVMGMRPVVLAIAFAACTSSPTRIELSVTSDPAWNLDGYELHVGFHAALSEPLDDLELQVPDSLAGMEQALEVWGTASGKQMAYGATMVTPVAHSTVHAEVMLAELACMSTCMQGATE